jgi:hypothetical protein
VFRPFPEPTSLRLYRLFGFDLASDFPFANDLPAGTAPAGLTFTLEPPPFPPAEWERTAPVYSSPFRSADGEHVALLYRQDKWEILRFPGLADFYLQPGRIACDLRDASPERLSIVELRLLGPVLCYWLERRGLPVLHGSAVGLGGHGLAFLSAQGGGKSGLAAAMMRFAGGALLTDDVLAVAEQDGGFLAQPGYPQMRMWPDEAEHFLGRLEGLPLVHPELAKRRISVGPHGLGRFQGSPVPLAAVFLPQRRQEGRGGTDVRRVAPAEAVIELVRHSFAPHLVEAAGLQPGRFDVLARLTQRVPVYRLSYPSGFDELPRLVEAVLRFPEASRRG